MEVSIIGYSWCPHFTHACEILKEQRLSLHITSLDIEPNRHEMQARVMEHIGNRRVIGTPGVTSPQIIVYNSSVAICIGGESDLINIGNVEKYCQPTFHTFCLGAP